MVQLDVHAENERQENHGSSRKPRPGPPPPRTVQAVAKESLAAGLKMYNSGDPIDAGLYVTCSNRPYGFLKVLKVEEEIVHVRLYKNKQDDIPARIDLVSLELGSINDKDGFGIGHLPISREMFASWQPQFLQHTLVEPEELEGYEAWKESQGGVWG